ncbi:MAG: response regulator [Bacteroides sp.]|nr:response regulator [Bacteroides sp.]
MRKVSVLLLVPALLCAAFMRSFADERKFSYLNVENGLRSNSVECIFQDREGMMWFGTHDGLSMYDTYHIRTWRHDVNDANSLGNNCIYSIFEDTSGKIWVGTERGIYIMDRDSGKFLSPSDCLADVHVHSIAEDKEGRIWIATLGDGVFCIGPGASDIFNWRHGLSDDSAGLNSDYSPSILVDAIGNVWCLTSGHYLYRFDEAMSDFVPIAIEDKERGVIEKNAFSMCLDWEGNLWIAGWDSGIFHYDTQTGLFTNYLYTAAGPVFKGRIHVIKELEPGKIYLGSDHGASVFEPKSGELETMSYGSSMYGGLSDDFVYDIFKDREGGLWIATYFGGVNYSNPNSSNFILRKCSSGSSRGRIISKFCEGMDRKIWIGTDDGGLFQYDPEEDRCRPVPVDSEVPNLNIHALLADSDYLWIGTYSNGLYRMDVHSGKVVHFRSFVESNGVGAQSVYSLFKDQTGKVWIGTKSSIWYWAEDKGFQCVKELGYNSDVIDIRSDAMGNIYFASISSGLFRYTPSTQVFEKLAAETDGLGIPDAILSFSVQHDCLLIGTSGNGLVRYDLKTGKVSSVPIPVRDMESMTVFHIINDDDNIWLSTTEGLLRYDTISGMKSFFGREDGLRTDIFSCNSGIKASDDRIYIGTNDGFNIFNPRLIHTNPIVPNTVFIDSPVQGLRDGGSIVLHKGHAPFAIGFAALSYRSPQKNQYRYMVEGLSDSWHELPWKDNHVTFAGLKCGTYHFKVCSCNNDALWGEPAVATIVVKPYWYNCTAAIVIYILSGILIFAVIVVMLRAYSIQKRSSKAVKLNFLKEKTRIETELRFFTNLAHEIKTPVMLINAPANEIASMADLPEKVRSNISLIKKSSDKLVGLTNEILNFRKCSNEMVLAPMQIVPLTRQAVEEFTMMTGNHGIDLKFIDNTDGKAVVNMNAEAWSKMMNNLLFNAVKFTKDLIEVTISVVDKRLVIRVYDNGIGIESSELKNIFGAFWHSGNSGRIQTPGFGLGLSITNMLAHKMGMELSVDSEVDKYTVFSISVPMEQGLPADSPVEGMSEPACSRSCAVVLNDRNMAKSLPPQKSISIMIVDDDCDLRNYLESSLSDEYVTFSAGNGEEALRTLRSGRKADLIISDVMMPLMDGIELCHQLKKDMDFSHIPIVLLSANSDSEMKMLSVQNGSDAYVEKPVDIHYLKTLINSLVEKRRALYDTFSKRPFLALQGIMDKYNEDTFIKDFSNLVLKNISMTSLNIEYLASEMHVSRTVLFRKVKESTDMTPNNYIKALRLVKAAEYLTIGKYKINEICWMVGFNTPSYFSKCFYEHFGVYPKDYVSGSLSVLPDEAAHE